MEDRLLVKFGEVINSVDGMKDSVRGLTKQQELLRVAFERQGLFLGNLKGDVALNQKHISKMLKRLDIEEEHTSRIVIERQVKQDTRKAWKWALGAAIALVSAAGTVIAALVACGG
jgi:hypothetical protein